MKKIISLSLFVFFSLILQLHAQEICDNGIDDDGDGLIDLNDEECFCETLIPSSLIPNPSFEDSTCCPMENERLDCAIGWIQASAATTDYVHTCGGYLGNTSIPAFAPLPFADGEGGVGFRDGQQNAGTNYKEYVGACLTEPMEVGATYRLDFFVGFQDDVSGSKDFNIAVFASTQCSNLPFGGNNFQIGCPLNAGGYVQIGEQHVSGNNEWVNVVFEFVASQAYEVIILGPGCAANSNFFLDPYFYVDRLALAESSEFGVPFESVTGSICNHDLTLKVEDDPQNTYQWYKDGVALIGETASSIVLSALVHTEGTYLVVITTPDGCLLSREYNLLIPPYYATESAIICEDEHYIFGLDTLTEAGNYERLLAAMDGCDSIIQLSLEILQNSHVEFRDTFCQGEPYSFLDINTTEEGTYQTAIPNAAGCDSLITLELTAVDLGVGLQVQETVSLDLGEKINLAPVFYDPTFTTFAWLDDLGNIIGDGREVFMYQPVRSGTVYLEAISKFGCKAVDSMTIEVIPIHSMYVPNVFSPDGNGFNDHFRFYPSVSFEKVHDFSVYDRWGGLVFNEQNIGNVSGYVGWDGTIDGKKAMPGVYVYIIHVLFLDGTEKVISGDVTLLR